MQRSILVAIVWCVGLAIPIWSAVADQIAFRFGPANDWRYLSFPGRQAAEFRAGGANTVVVRADSAVGVLWHAIPQMLSGASIAQWRWRVTAGVGPTDLTKKGGDDRTLAIYFVLYRARVRLSELPATAIQWMRGHHPYFDRQLGARPPESAGFHLPDHRSRADQPRQQDCGRGPRVREHCPLPRPRRQKARL